MAGSCGAFCSFCGKCGRRVTKVFDVSKVPAVPPPGTPLGVFADTVGELGRFREEEARDDGGKDTQGRHITQ